MSLRPLPTPRAIAHIRDLLLEPSVPDLPPEADKDLCFIHEYLTTLRSILDAFARGDLSMDIFLRGVVAGRLKSLQANLLHLTWQIEQVAAGDLTQRVEFMGKYSVAFNSMVTQLDEALTTLRQKEEELTQLTEALQKEVAEKADALVALGKSKARFKHLAEHDALTGVLNRRSFYEISIAEFKRAGNEGYPCSLALVDIDFFKNLNDTYGHLEGDAALRHLTNVMEASLRRGGLVGRYGGEEFMVLLSGLALEQAKKVAERLRRNIAESPLQTEKGPIPITVSIGLAYVPPESGTTHDAAFLESVFNIADAAMYAAKQAGRNCLMVAPYRAGHETIMCREAGG